MIEEPSASQRHASAIAGAAHLLANGRAPESVRGELKRRGLSSEEIESGWEQVSTQGRALMEERRKRLGFVGTCWLLVGLVLLGGLLWSLMLYGRFPWILILGVAPSWYGLSLLCLPPTKDPDFESPPIFGKNL